MGFATSGPTVVSSEDVLELMDAVEAEGVVTRLTGAPLGRPSPTLADSARLFGGLGVGEACGMSLSSWLTFRTGPTAEDAAGWKPVLATEDEIDERRDVIEGARRSGRAVVGVNCGEGTGREARGEGGEGKSAAAGNGKVTSSFAGLTVELTCRSSASGEVGGGV